MIRFLAFPWYQMQELGRDACVLHQSFNEIAEWCILEKTWNKQTWLRRMSKTKRKKIILIPCCLTLYSEGTWGTFTIQSCAYWKTLGQESIFLVTFVKWNYRVLTKNETRRSHMKKMHTKHSILSYLCLKIEHGKSYIFLESK